MQEGFITFLFFLHLAIPLRRHLSPPSLHAKLIGWKERKRNGMEEEKEGWKTLCIWKCPERGVIYVCIRCRFHYGPVAQVRSFQEHRGDLMKLSLITGHTGIEGNYWQRQWEKRGKKESKRQIEEAYLQPGHTHLTHRERVNCNLPSKKDGSGSQTGVHLKDEWERKRGGIDGKESVNVCLWITVVNCEHWWGVCMGVYVSIQFLYIIVVACEKPDKLHFTTL